MSWWEHKHYWVVRDAHAVAKKEGGNVGSLVFQQCSCGAVRTIEYGPGQIPIIRMAKTEEK